MRLSVPVLVLVGSGLTGCAVYGWLEAAGGAPAESAATVAEVTVAESTPAGADTYASSAAEAAYAPRTASAHGRLAAPAAQRSGADDTGGDREGRGSAAVRRAVERALPFLEEQGIAWMDGRVPIQDGQACVSCHHVPYAVWSHAEARRAGIEVAEAMDGLEARAVAFAARPSAARALNLAPLLLGRAAAQSLSAPLLAQQEPGGHFRARGQFPAQRRPVAEGDAVATGLSLLALETLSPEEGGGAETARARERGEEWLARTREEWRSTEWMAVQLLRAAPRPNAASESAEAQELRDRLEALQNPDGGWPWSAGEPSNAYSTGVVLYALAATAGSYAAGETGAVEAGRRYLLETQDTDGTWTVASSLISEEGTEDRDVVYRYWGTAWATIGLARSLDSVRGPGQSETQQDGL